MSFSNSLREQTDRIDSCAFCGNDPLMADKGGSRKQTGTSASAHGTLARSPAELDPLVTTLGGGKLDFGSMLAIADVLPVMVGYVDEELRLQFANRPFADWLETPRAELIGRLVRDIIGSQRVEQRESHYRKALAGERLFFASEFDHPTRGSVALQSDYVPWADEH